MNHLLIVLDSISHEIFSVAKTPNMNRIGKVEDAWTPACWTLPTAVSMFHIPFYTGKPLIGSESYLPHTWLPTTMSRCGFNTSLITDNPWFEIYRDFLSRGFSSYITQGKISMKKLFMETRKHLKPPFFTVLWVTGTHHHDNAVGSDGIKAKHYTKSWQIEALHKADGFVGRLVKRLPDNTEVVVTSDHGDSYNGSVLVGHHPKDVKSFDERLFKVFLVRGHIPLNTSSTNSTL